MLADRSSLGCLPAVHCSHADCPAFATFPFSSQASHEPPKLTVPARQATHSSAVSQAPSSRGQVVPGRQTVVLQYVWLLMATFGSKQSRQTPPTENVAPTHAAQLVPSGLGPSPIGHDVHAVSAPVTIFGNAQSRQLAPIRENVPILHATHAVLSAFGSSPGAHFVHVWWLSSTMYGSSQA